MDPTLAGLFGGVGGLVVGYWTAFWSQKGKNATMAQDIAEITELTKKIEAKISNEMWVGQRTWDLKRSAASRLVEEMGSFQESILKLRSSWVGLKDARLDERHIAEARHVEVFEAYTKRTSDLWRAKMVAELILGEKIIYDVHVFEQKARHIVDLTQPPAGTDEDFNKAIAAAAEACKKVLNVVREELVKA